MATIRDSEIPAMAEQLAGELDFPNEKFVEEDRHLHEELKECRTPVLEQLKAVDPDSQPTGGEHTCYDLEALPHDLQEVALVAMGR